MAYVDCDSHILPGDAFDEVAPEFRDQGPHPSSGDQSARAIRGTRRQGRDDGRRAPHRDEFRKNKSGFQHGIDLAKDIKVRRWILLNFRKFYVFCVL